MCALVEIFQHNFQLEQTLVLRFNDGGKLFQMLLMITIRFFQCSKLFLMLLDAEVQGGHPGLQGARALFQRL